MLSALNLRHAFIMMNWNNTALTVNLPQAVRPEDEILLCCARSALDPQTVDRIKALAAATIDWNYLCWSAGMHGLLPMLYWRINACCAEVVPQPSRELLRVHYEENARHHAEADAWLGGTLRLLHSAGIQAVPIGGPPVAAALYSPVALRQTTDIRLLVREQDLERAKDLLCARGCLPSFSSPGGVTARERIFTKANRGCVLGTPDMQTHVELRYEITPAHFRLKFDVERVFRRAPLPASRLAEMTPSPEHLLLILCLDGARHLWKELAALCDIAELIRKHDDLDWTEVLRIARIERCLPVLLLGLLLAEQRLGLQLPSAIQQQVHSDGAVTAAVAAISGRPFTSARRPSGLLERLRFHLPLRQRLRDKLSLAIALAIPGPEDVPSLPTPAALDFVYYVARPFRFCASRLKRQMRSRPQSAPWSGTPPDGVDRMLALARVRPDDLVYDLGCGDGRIVIHAAKHHAARGVGVDVDAARVRESRDHARREGVNGLVRFAQMDGFDVNLEDATVVALFMTPEWNDSIARKLRDELPPGARVVSWNIDIAGWYPQQVEIVRVGQNTFPIYLWQIDCQR